MKAGPARAVHDQIGARNTWMRCEAFDAPAQRLAAPAQLDREHEAGELGLCIDLHRPVTALCLQIVEIDSALERCEPAERDDPRNMTCTASGKKTRKSAVLGERGAEH